MENINKIVKFEDYCGDCEYFDTDERFDPCHECLNNPSNINSRKPVKFKKKEKREKDKKEK